MTGAHRRRIDREAEIVATGGRLILRDTTAGIEVQMVTPGDDGPSVIGIDAATAAYIAGWLTVAAGVKFG